MTFATPLVVLLVALHSISTRSQVLRQPALSALPTEAIDTNFNTTSNIGQNCLKSQQVLVNAFQGFILRSLKYCSTNLELERKRLRNCTAGKGQIETEVREDAMIEQYKSRFVSKSTADLVTKEPSENETEDTVRMAVIRAWSGIRDTAIADNHEVCPTRFRVISPTTLFHISGMPVTLWSSKNRKQLFFIRECRRSRPLLSISTESARCETVHNLHKAIIRIERTLNTNQQPPFRSCALLTNSTYFICDEWVRIGSSCALFI